MATKPTKAAAQQRKPHARPSEDEYDSVLARVEELWGKSNGRVARQLIDEGYCPEPPIPRGALPVGADAQKEHTRLHELNVKRKILNWREAIRDRWRKRKKPTADDREVSSQDYIASLRTELEGLEDIAEAIGPATPRVQARSEIRQIKQAIAKAEGVDQISETPTNPGTRALVVGVLLGMRNVSAEMRERLREQGCEIGDNE